MEWNQKEQSLLKDLKEQEQLCANKYMRHAQDACDPQLKQLFADLSRMEAKHLKTVTDMELGQVPTLHQQPAKPAPAFSAAYQGDSREKQNDCFLCTDLLTGEKHMSGLYDTCIFEFRDGQARTVLNHIQKEEQGHGKLLYDYMKVNGMYEG